MNCRIMYTTLILCFIGQRYGYIRAAQKRSRELPVLICLNNRTRSNSGRRVDVFVCEWEELNVAHDAVFGNQAANQAVY